MEVSSLPLGEVYVGRPQAPALPCASLTGIPPNKYHYIDDLVVILPQSVWEHLYSR